MDVSAPGTYIRDPALGHQDLGHCVIGRDHGAHANT